MGRPKKQYKPGDKIGTYQLTIVEEVEPHITAGGTKFRQFKVICPNCGKTFIAKMGNLNRKEGGAQSPIKQCFDCSQAENNKRLSNLGREMAAKGTVGNIYNDFKVIKMSNKRRGREAYYWCECIYCGKKHEITGTDLKRGHKKYCENPECRLKRKLKSISGPNHIDLSGQTFGKWKVIEYSHTDSHGEIYYLCECSCDKHTRRPVQARNLRNGRSQSCGCKTSSKGEDKIAEMLNELNIKYLYDTTKLNCINPKTKAKLRFDFFLPDYNCCIEFDGEQHFEECSRCGDTLIDRQYRDNVKNNFCKEHNIKLIRIPYFDYDKLNKDYIKSLLQ